MAASLTPPLQPSGDTDARAVTFDSQQVVQLRAYACVLLVLYHVVGADPGQGLRIDSGPLRLFNDGLAFLRMPLFAFLSGLVFAGFPTQEDPRTFFMHKARALLVPTVLVGTLFALTQAFIGDSNAHIDNWWLLHTLPVGHFWFLEALFWIFALAYVLDLRGGLATPARWAAVWIPIVLLHMSMQGTRYFALDGALYLLPYFLVGLAVTRFHLRPRLLQPLMQAGLLLLLLVAMVQVGEPHPNPDRRLPWMVIEGLALCGLSMSVNTRSRWLAHIGHLSYSIYLFHVFFTAAVRILLYRLEVQSLTLHVLVGVVAGVGGPVVVHHLLARSKIGRLLFMIRSPAGRIDQAPSQDRR